MADHGQFIFEGQLAQGVVFVSQEAFFPGIAVGPGLADGRTVMGQLMGLDAGQQIGALPHEEEALTQEGAQGAFVSGIDVGRRDEIGAQEVGNLFGINAIVFVFAAVNGFEVEGMSQAGSACSHGASREAHWGQGSALPAEHAFTADGQVMLVGLDQLEEELEVVVSDVGMDQLFAQPIHEADVHLMGMKVDSAVEFGGGCIILHC
jgi:hypothetical protein